MEKLFLESDIVSGLPSDPHKKTPAGTYYIYFMQLNRTLRGEIQADGKPEYETPVAYWMAFNGGIGLHDATWQSRFGGDVYYTRGSHGCINLPLKVAAELYDMVKVNTPVVCYY
ncbi:MAG: L,D-transpeptidase [Coprobacillus cateniformis]